MKLILPMMIVAVAVATPALAQERAAGQANDAQVTWSALSAKLDAVGNQNKAIAASVATLQTSVNGINGKLDAIAACGAQKKVWTGTGCITAASSCVPTYTALSGGSCPAGTTKTITGISNSSGGTRIAGGGSSGGSYSSPSASASYSCMRIVCN